MLKLTPVRHPTLADHHRVPVIRIDGRYEIYVEEDFVRIYDDEDLPDLVKTRMAMAKAGTKELGYEGMVTARIYECSSANKHLADIGWCITDDLAVLVLPTKYLTYLKTQEYDSEESYQLLNTVIKIKARKRPTFYTLEEYIDWLRLKSK
jgi:hypothetical protein